MTRRSGLDRTYRNFVKKSIKPRHLLLALEPETAALYCLNLPPEQRQVMNNFGEKGDKFVVIDLGGGTVDILAIEVLDDGNVKEICPGSGGRVGGQDVNNAFFQYCKDVFKDNMWYEISSCNMEEILQMEMDFENKKVSIGSTDSKDEKIHLQVPTNMIDMIKDKKLMIDTEAKCNEFFAIKNNKFRFSSKLVRDVLFGETIQLVLEYVHTVMHDKLNDIETVVIVGGFAESNLVVKKMEDFLKKDYPRLSVVVPTFPCRAVLMGAVLYGHDPFIFNSRISRATFGIGTNVVFNSVEHDIEKKWYNKEDGKYYCRNIFSIHVKKGDSVRIKDNRSCMYYVPLWKHQTQVSIDVFLSEERTPKYTTDNGCRKIGSVSVQLPLSDEGIDRGVKVEMIYGGTELGVIATNRQTEEEISVTYTFSELPDETKRPDETEKPDEKERSDETERPDETERNSCTLL